MATDYHNAGAHGTRLYIADLSMRELVREARLLHRLTTGRRYELWPRQPLPVLMRPRWAMVRDELVRRRRLPSDLEDTCPECSVTGRWRGDPQTGEVDHCLACGAGMGGTR